MYLTILKEQNEKNTLIIVPPKCGSRFISFLVGNSWEIRKTFFPSLELIGSNRIDKNWDISEYKFDEIILITRNHIDRFISATLQIMEKENVNLDEFFEFVNDNNFEDSHYNTDYESLKSIFKSFVGQMMILGDSGQFVDKRWNQKIRGKFSICDITSIESIGFFQRNFKVYKETNDKLDLWELLEVFDESIEQQLPFVKQHIELKSFFEFCRFVRTPVVSQSKLVQSNKSKLNCTYDDIKKEIESDVNLKERIDRHYLNDYEHQTWRIT